LKIPSSEKASKIDIRAQQQQSLVKGLQQQQEPSEDEEYISLRITTGTHLQSIVSPNSALLKDEDSCPSENE
jgi:hypothetical protein